jgi:hypothetical protein
MVSLGFSQQSKVARLQVVGITARLVSMTGLIRMTVTTAAAAIFMVLAIGFFGWSNERHSRFTCESGTHVAQPFDTIWNIARTRCEGNLQNAVYHIVQLNGGTASIQIGQKIRVPSTGDTNE